ncbi:MAG: hypothetical protein ACK457_03615 [Flavobacteriia bacterium]
MKLLLFPLLLLASACGMLTTADSQQPTLKTVQLSGSVHKPYCGGAKPHPDVASGYNEALSFEKVAILRGTSYTDGMPVFKEVQLDESGKITLQLEKGNYMLMLSDKFLSLEDFMNENGSIENEHYRLKDPDCFKQWKTTVDLYFTVESDTLIAFQQKAKCWVGTNPCLEYVGPPAP